MVYIREEGGDEISLSSAMDKYTSPLFKTATLKGTGTPAKYSVPYHGKDLKGNELRQKIEDWVRSGVIEASCGSSLQKVLDNPDWVDLTGQHFVLFGAASAMGPFPLLMALGATVVALDLDRKPIWDMLIKKARASPGTLVFPVKESPAGKSDDELAAIAGCNLLTNTPEIRTWLLEIAPKERLVLGAYAYLDGPLFVKVSVAMDAIIKELVKKRQQKPAIAYLCTPTDCHVVPNTAMEHSRQNFNRQPMWQSLAATLLSVTGKRMTRNFSRPVEGTEISVCDAIVPDQGPNYILAKRLQHWRAILARRDGCIVSTNIAPSTATKSVVSNRAFALAYKGMHHFKPVEVFQQETSTAVMTGLMITDLNDVTSAASPTRKLDNPMCLFAENSFHGGAWRCGYKFGNIGIPAALAYCFLTAVVFPYMMGYNFTQVFGWGKALLGLVNHEIEGTGVGLWDKIGGTVTFFQYLAALEIVHAIIGFVRTGVATTALQLFSRVALVAVVNDSKAQFASDNVWIRMMLFAWSLTEVIRYSYYGLPTNNKVLTWLRYTLFIVLYPMGVIGEIGCLNHAATTAPASTSSNSLYYIQAFYKYCGGLPTLITVYLIGLSGLYSHMLAQRSKILGRKPSVRPADGVKKNQ